VFCFCPHTYYLSKEKSLSEYKLTFGRVGAINLEQLDLLLNSLKTYWDYTNQKSFLEEIKAPVTSVIEGKNVLGYEL
jgi:hypothetical protein